MRTWMTRGLIAVLLVGFCSVSFGLVPHSTETTEELYAAHADEVVKVSPLVKSGSLWVPWGHGSGVLLNTRGAVLTAAHVAKHGPLFLIETKSGESYRAGLVALDPAHDLAILQPLRGFRWLSAVALGKSLAIGTQVAHIGCPREFDWAMSSGLVAWMSGHMLLTDTVIAPGSSGGALYNRRGELVGLAIAILLSGDAPMGFTVFTDIYDIRHFVSAWEVVL